MAAVDDVLLAEGETKLPRNPGAFDGSTEIVSTDGTETPVLLEAAFVDDALLLNADPRAATVAKFSF